MESLQSTSSAKDKKRKKVALKPGCSLMNWVKLCNSGKDLAGTKGEFLTVNSNTLKLHNTVSDAWMAINGIVYNVTEYMSFHPGGEEELMRGVGMDATRLFNQVHSWVNYESLLRCCVVGRLVKSMCSLQPPLINQNNNNKTIIKKDQLASTLATSFINSLSVGCNNDLPKSSNFKIDWYQRMNSLCVVFYVKTSISVPFAVSVLLLGDKILVNLIDEIEEFTLESEINWPCTVKIKSYVVEFQLIKKVPSLWTNFSSHSVENAQHLFPFNNKMTVLSNLQLTHDTKLIALKYVHQIFHFIHIGYHVSLQGVINDEEVKRPYTPVPLILNEQDNSIVFGSAPSSNIVIYFIVKYYPNGKLSNWLCSRDIGDIVYMSEPTGSFSVSSLKDKTHVVLLAAGTGITPMISILQWSLRATEVKISLVLFNKTEADNILSKEIDLLAEKNSRLTVYYQFGKQAAKELIVSAVPSYNGQCFICVCGPTSFNDLCLHTLNEMGYSDADFHCFQ